MTWRTVGKYAARLLLVSLLFQFEFFMWDYTLAYFANPTNENGPMWAAFTWVFINACVIVIWLFYVAFIMEDKPKDKGEKF